MIRATLLLLATAGALAPVTAAAQTATVTVDPVRRALGYELAQLLNPEAPIMAALEIAFGDPLPGLLLSEPAFREMEDKYPGIAKAAADAMRPILLRYMRDSLPEMWDRIAVIYAELSEADLRAAIAFYRSPTGSRIIALMTSEADLGPLLDSMMTDSDTSVTTSDELLGDARTMAVSAVDRLSPEQIKEAAAFAQSPAGRRILALQPRVAAVMAELASTTSPEAEAEVAAAIRPVIERFTGVKN